MVEEQIDVDDCEDMMKSLELIVPDEIYTTLGEAEVRDLAQEALLVRLYSLGKIGSGQAARLLGVPRRTFILEILGHYGVSHFDETIDLVTEAKRG